MREVRIRPRAQLDIESAFIYIAQELHEPKAARNLADELFDTFDRLADMPSLGRVIADEELEREYRRTLVQNHWIYYTFDETTLTVWRVFHTRQDIDNYSIAAF